MSYRSSVIEIIGILLWYNGSLLLFTFTCIRSFFEIFIIFSGRGSFRDICTGAYYDSNSSLHSCYDRRRALLHQKEPEP